MTICGIYSDITNAGKTAKATFQAKGADFVRVVIPIELTDRMTASQTAARYQSEFPFATIAVSDEYVRQTFGGTLAAIQKAAFASIATAVLLTILITLLFMKMIVTKDRYSIAILKSLGFSDKEIRWQYVARSIIVAALGVIIGMILANTLGELIGMALISTLGATTFQFAANPFYAYLFVPLLIAVCVYSATLLFALSGMDSITSGSVMFGDAELSKLRENERADIRRTRMGFIFQQPTMLKNLDLLDNIILPSAQGGKKDRAKLTQKAKDMMKKTGIGGLENREITEVSGGQLQRAGICRVLMNSPEILFADEPTGALNSKSAEAIMGLLLDINREGTAILIVTHEAKEGKGFTVYTVYDENWKLVGVEQKK